MGWVIFGLPGLLILAYETTVFLLSLKLRDNSVADQAWGGGFCLVAVATLTARDTAPGPLQWLATGLTLVWGVRLMWHIGRRKLVRPGEDFRYRAWREAWGRTFVWRSFLQIYLLQGAILLVVALPVTMVNGAPAAELGMAGLFGTLLWLTGFVWETVADAQVSAFRRLPENRGRLCMTGLWRFCRHPNYFGEALLWLGMGLLALPVAYGDWALASPLLITFLLRFVSGVPMLERRHLADPDFRRYSACTNAFIPWFPKREDAN